MIPHEEESKYVIKMYEMLLKDIDPDEVVATINSTWFRTRKFYRRDKENKKKILSTGGGKKLTRKTLSRYVKRPIYCGFICEKWTQNKPIKARFEGLVSIETFNNVNVGKIRIEKIQMDYGK